MESASQLELFGAHIRGRDKFHRGKPATLRLRLEEAATEAPTLILLKNIRKPGDQVDVIRDGVRVIVPDCVAEARREDYVSFVSMLGNE